MVKAPPTLTDSNSKDCAFNPDPTAVSRIILMSVNNETSIKNMKFFLAFGISLNKLVRVKTE